MIQHPTICRLGVFATVLTIGFVLFWVSHEPIKRDYWCDLQTDNCYARLAEKLK